MKFFSDSDSSGQRGDPSAQAWHKCYRGAVSLKITSVLTPRFSFRTFSLLTLISVLIFFTVTVCGQGQPQPATAKTSDNQAARRGLLPDVIGSAWRATGPAKKLSAEQYKVVQGAEACLEYGLQSVMTRAYSSRQDSALIEVFEMRYPSGAYGLFTFNRGTLPPGRTEFYSGSYVVRVAGSSAESAPDQALVSALAQSLAQAPADLSPLPSHLSEKNRVAESEKYLVGPVALTDLKQFADLKDVISFTGGAEAVTAQYENGGGQMSLLIVDCYTPQLAADNYNRLKSHLESLSPDEKASRLSKRIGNYVVLAVGVRDSSAAEAVLKEIKYAPRVYWEGDRFNSIPYEYRPPDPLALEEARRTGTFLITTFYMISLMILGSVLLGIIAGGSFFFWRRYQRRRLGFEDAFSDAGGTIRLNLDGFLLPAADDAGVKLLEKGD